MATQGIKSTVLIPPQHLASTYFIHLFNRQIESVYYMPGAVLSAGDTTVKRTDKNPSLRELGNKNVCQGCSGEVL